jgi:copper chaperone CopZ
MKAKNVGILSAILGSICCVGPLLLIAVGLGAGAAGISRYHWLFIAAAIVALAFAWTRYFREKTTCACEPKTVQWRRSGTVTLLIATAIVLGFVGMNTSHYLFAGTSASAQTQPPVASGMDRIVIPVQGMTCATCEVGVRYVLKSVKGVESARVNAATKTATVDYDPTKTDPEKLVSAINSTGYRATLPHEASLSTSKTVQRESSKERNIGPERISLFKVSLQCPAAPHIGCGTASKPILLQLEEEPGVAEAWLNRPGTQIAIVWKPEADAAARHNVAAKLTDDAKEMVGEQHNESLEDFQSGKGWYHGADVDRLSEEEAGIIAARLIRRVEAKTPLSKEKAQEFQHDLAESWSKCVTSGNHIASNSGGQPMCRFEDIGETIARRYLNEEQLKFWKEAVRRGVRPLPNEGKI